MVLIASMIIAAAENTAMYPTMEFIISPKFVPVAVLKLAKIPMLLAINSATMTSNRMYISSSTFFNNRHKETND